MIATPIPSKRWLNPGDPLKWVLPAALLMAILCYWPLLEGLSAEWYGDPDMGHGFLALPLALWIAWRQRARLGLRQPSWWGVALVGSGAALQFAGAVSLGLFVGTLGFIAAVAGVVIAAGGFAWLRTLAFPLFLLLFMLPKPEFAWGYIAEPLQTLASRLAAEFAGWLGTAVERQGNVLVVGGHPLAVEEACSGLRYLLSLGFVSLVWAWLAGCRGVRLAAAGLLAVPVALFVNALRVAAVAIMFSFDERFAAGIFHDLSGWATLFLALLMVAAALRELQPRNGAIEPVCTGATLGSASSMCLIAATTVLAIQIIPVRLAPLLERPPRLAELSSFPSRFAEWQLTREAWLPAEELSALKADDFARRFYAIPGQSRQIELRLAYYRSQRVHGLLPHSPRICLPANGWSVVQSSARISTGDLNVYEAERNGERALVLYWYQTPWQTTASEWETRAWVTLNGLTRWRTDVALVTLVTAASGNSNEARETTLDLAPRVMAAVQSYLK